MPETKVPALADPVTVKDPQLKRVLASYKEALEIRLGRRGDKLDRAITLRELISAGIAKLGPGGSFSGEEIVLPEFYDPRKDLGTMPTAPTGFKAEGGFGTVILEWDKPYDAYKNHAYTEIWRAPIDNIGDSILVGLSSDFMYSDPVGTGGTFYYWARFVSESGIIGPFNGTAGTMAETAIPADQIKQELLNSLGYEHFDVATGAFPIKLVSALPPLPDTRFPQGATVSLLPNAILYRTTNGSTWTQVVSAGEMAGQITTGQIAANAITSGKILAGAVLADKIATGAIVSDKIASNAVTSAKIVAGAVTADKISVSQLSAVSSNLGTIQVGNANIQNGAITNAKISDLSVDIMRLTGGHTVTVLFGSGTTAAQVSYNPGSGYGARYMVVGTATMGDGTAGQTQVSLTQNGSTIYTEVPLANTIGTLVYGVGAISGTQTFRIQHWFTSGTRRSTIAVFISRYRTS